MASTPWRASVAAPSTLRVCRCALMAALALALTALESLIPVPMPVPNGQEREFLSPPIPQPNERFYLFQILCRRKTEQVRIVIDKGISLTNPS